jgi:hypothetical protein
MVLVAISEYFRSGLVISNGNSSVLVGACILGKHFQTQQEF